MTKEGRISLVTLESQDAWPGQCGRCRWFITFPLVKGARQITHDGKEEPVLDGLCLQLGLCTGEGSDHERHVIDVFHKTCDKFMQSVNAKPKE